jgi:hypothetical protein
MDYPSASGQKYNKEQQEQQQLHNTKELENCVNTDTIFLLTIGNGTRTKVPTEFPDHYTSMLSANSFCTEDKPKQKHK